jgi:hypothetical protein
MRVSASVLALVAALAVAVSPVSAAADATVYIVHGVPTALLDLQVDGECVLESIAFGQHAGPQEVTPGIHQITVRMADQMNPCTGMIVLDIPVLLEDGENVTAVAFLDEMCEPTAAKFENDFSRTEPGMARVVLHHTACAPAIDITVARGQAGPIEHVVEGIANGDQVVAQVHPGNWLVTATVAGTDEPVGVPVWVQVKPFRTYCVYAVGNAYAGVGEIVVLEERSQ